MILFKKKFKQKMLDGTKTCTYRTRQGMYYKPGDVVNTNFRENKERVMIKIIDIQPVVILDFNTYKTDGFDSIEEMKNYFQHYDTKKLNKITFSVQ